MKNSDMPAMPVVNQEIVTAFIEVEEEAPNGLTKREYMAAMAMQGLVSNLENHPIGSELHKSLSGTSIQFADALLEALDA